MGLSISKRLIESMNGRITVQSRVDKGSNFEITLRNIAISSTEIPVEDEKYKLGVIADTAKSVWG